MQNEECRITGNAIASASHAGSEILRRLGSVSYNKQRIAPARVRRWSHQVWIERPKKNLTKPSASLASGFAPDPAIRHPKPAIRNALVLVQPIAQRELIVAVNDAARAKSIRPGMTLSEARALDATVKHASHEPYRDAIALEALARWMMRFSPIVSPLAAIQNHGLFLDLTGCERVFGGIDKIIPRVRDALDRFRITAHLTVAPNPAAAWALTFSPKHQDAIVEQDELHNALLELRPSALRLDETIVESLHHLGLTTIGQLTKLPRESLPARFGQQLLLRIDQAFGRIAEPLVPLEPFSPISARMDFDGSVDSLEAIWLVFKTLLKTIVADLLKRGCGARAIDVEFFRPYAVTLYKSIRLSRPSRDPVNLFNLLRCAMETVETDVGFLGIQLIVTSAQRVSDEQIALLEHEEFAGEIELDHLIERLSVRMGQETVAQAEPIESHVPEYAFTWHGRLAHAPGAQAINAWARRPCHELRPLHLFDWPEEILVTVSPSDHADGFPIQFSRPSYGGATHRLSHSIGPERIAGQWWRGHDKTRDYFDVEDEKSGQRFWVFRVQETGKWFVHGEFE
ncbi:MAG: DNA polymerase Y family protein [Anaerolineae bacterium]|nr:DNA polymerase Y family protein [Phycisphaerae bacterium]